MGGGRVSHSFFFFVHGKPQFFFYVLSHSFFFLHGNHLPRSRIGCKDQSREFFITITIKFVLLYDPKALRKKKHTRPA